MKIFQKTPLALAIATLVASPVALAGGNSPPDVEIDKSWSTDVEVDVEKDLNTEKDVDIHLLVFGVSVPFANAFSQAYIESNQVNTNNEVLNAIVDNDARVGNSGSGASGNIGINVVGGDNNQQANDAALASTDARFVFAMSEVDSLQTNTAQGVLNDKVSNQATVNDSVNNVSGNLGLNVAAGNNNQQHNALAASVNTSFGNVAEADVIGMQHSEGNNTANIGQQARVETTPVQVTMSGSVSGTYSGQSDQIGDVYLDTWDGALPHPNGDSTGHIDVDSDAQGAQDLNDDGGAFAFNEAGTATLSGSFTGNVVFVNTFDEIPHHNNARLTNSLNGVSGNIGANIAAGTGNQQRNTLSISAAMGGSPGTPGGPGGEL